MARRPVAMAPAAPRAAAAGRARPAGRRPSRPRSRDHEPGRGVRHEHRQQAVAAVAASAANAAQAAVRSASPRSRPGPDGRARGRLSTGRCSAGRRGAGRGRRSPAPTRSASARPPPRRAGAPLEQPDRRGVGRASGACRRARRCPTATATRTGISRTSRPSSAVPGQLRRAAGQDDPGRQHARPRRAASRCAAARRSRASGPR